MYVTDVLSFGGNQNTCPTIDLFFFFLFLEQTHTKKNLPLIKNLIFLK